jgi:hypothetical protein
MSPSSVNRRSREAVAPMRIVARRVIRSNMVFTIATSLGKLRRITLVIVGMLDFADGEAR